jgi:hypothetical protein
MQGKIVRGLLNARKDWAAADRSERSRGNLRFVFKPRSRRIRTAANVN